MSFCAIPFCLIDLITFPNEDIPDEKGKIN